MIIETLLPRVAVELRTPTAITAVQGTDWIVEAAPQATGAAALAGEVAVRNRDPAVPGSVVLRPGEGTTVEAGAAPAPPAPWGPARRQSLIERTALPDR